MIALAVSLHGQGSEPGGVPKRLVFGASLLGSSNELGVVTRLDASAGYLFNRHWSLEFGVPYYFVSPSSSTASSTGTSSFNGVGNVYSRIRFVLLNPSLNYASALSVAAPTGDKTLGLSTGRGIVDWSNYFDHSFRRLTPFAEVGFANAVSDTMIFVRPYTTAGLVTRLQGGARYGLARWLTVGASGYSIIPTGQQTVVSRVVSRQTTRTGTGNPPVTVPGQGAQKRVFEDTTVITGPADLARDKGYSTWLQIGSGQPINFQVGYTRSTTFGLDTIFFGAGFSVRKTLGAAGF